MERAKKLLTVDGHRLGQFDNQVASTLVCGRQFEFECGDGHLADNFGNYGENLVTDLGRLRDLSCEAFCDAINHLSCPISRF